jgi:hypothetical protein
VLSLKDNRLATKEGGEALAQALANNSTLKELDVSSNVWKVKDKYGIHDKGDGPGFAQELAVGIKDNGALSVANVMGNGIGKEQLAKLQDIMHAKPNLVSLCGIANDATKADLSGLGMNADDAAVLASELPDKRALSTLIFGGDTYSFLDATGTVVEDVTPDPATLKVGMTEADFSNMNLGVNGAIIIAAWLTHKDKGALMRLDISSNNLTNFEEDMTGAVCSSVLYKWQVQKLVRLLFLSLSFLQVLSLLPTPSLIWGHYRRYL